MANPAIQRLIAKAMLAMPAPVMRAIAGGGAVTKGGRTLDPQFQLIAYGGRGNPPMSRLTPAQARMGASAGFAAMAGKPEPGVAFEDLTLDLPHAALPARAYRPATLRAEAPLIVWLHQGGGVIGDLETSHSFCTILAAAAGAPVLSIDYRLAPEHPYPAAVDDALAAFRWARANAARFGGPSGRAALGGDSMGGLLTAIVCQDLRRAGEAQPSLQILVYPAVDADSDTPSMTEFADAFPLTRETMEWFLLHYGAPKDQAHEVRHSPLREPDLSGLAPAVIATAGFDPLTDQGAAYARRLSDAGVPVHFKCYDSLAHGFLSFGGAVRAADRAAREIATSVRYSLPAAD